jgi:peptide/nickel transport system substrate-binding protein
MLIQHNSRKAISTGLSVAIIVVLVIAAIGGIYYFTLSSPSPTLSSSTSTTPPTSTTTTTTTTGPVPSTLTYEWAETTQYLDPDVSYLSSDYNVLQNVYEPLVFFNGTSPTSIVPWLAQSWTPNTAGTQVQVTLRSGIKFADGEPLNSTAVYFSLNRALVFDASTPTGHCSQGGWLIQQEVNQTLSCFYSGAQNYGKGYADAWLAQNFVQVTGPLTFNLNLKIPNPAFEAIMAQPAGYIMPPMFVMQHDMALWTQASTGYTLPNPTLSGSLNNQIQQYLEDLSSTCNSGVTPSGCALTYLDHSVQGSMAGTGPYTITSVDLTNNIVTLQANPNYWGAPYQFSGGQKITPQIQTIIFKFVPDVTTREIDLKNAASSGQAMAIDLPSTNLYDVADRASWINSGVLKSDIPGVTMYGPYPQLALSFFPFDMNVSSPFNPSVEVPFQPFADFRIRLAFADAVNMTAEWNSVDNKIGEVAPNVVPPGLPPAGVYNASNGPIYSYNPDKAAQLLISAMQDPITHFTFVNGTAAPPGYFNNSFGCTTFQSTTPPTCAHPIQQTITLTVADGYPVDESILNDMASVLNNISLTYNMGLTVSVAREPFGTMVTQAFSPPSPLYMYDLGWFQDYPWILDFTLNMFNYPGSYPAGMGTNITAMNTLYHESISASEANNLPALIKYSNLMNQIANARVTFLWEFDSVNYVTMTSNVQGLYWNTNAATAAFNGIGPEFFATLY